MTRRNFLVRGPVPLLAAASAPAQQEPRSIQIGDARLKVSLEWGGAGVREIAYHVTGALLTELRGDPWQVTTDAGIFSASQSPAALVQSDASRQAVFEGQIDGIHWRLEYRLSGPGRITKLLHLNPLRRVKLSRVSLWSVESRAEPRVARLKRQDIAAFYRMGRRGVFASLDFPYSNIAQTSGRTTVSYPPHDTLEPGVAYECHSLTAGAVELTGIVMDGSDRGELEAFDRYVQEHVAPRFQRPMNIYASIVNRYTQVRGGIVFYSMKDQPGFFFNVALAERDLSLMSNIGMEYYQLFPGVFEWPSDAPSSAVTHLTEYARKRGLRIGDYSGTSIVYSPHFNIARHQLGHPDWLIRDANAVSEEIYCFGNPAFVRYYQATVVANCRQYGFGIHCLDLLKLAPCFATDHDHPPGPESLYHQVRGLLAIISSINAVAPQMLTWPNSGDWVEMLPKLAWYAPNLYLTDPFINTPWQGLNMTRLLDDARREQMVSLHHSAFLPYRFFTNCQYFFSQNSVVPDVRNFEYGALSTLAVTPNLCLGEFRPWLDGLPAADQDRVIGFYRHWTKLIADHFTLWTQTCEFGERPGFGSVEIYAHAAGRHGFIFLVNPNYWDRTIEIPLDQALGFSAQGRCEIAELYPVSRLRLTSQGPWPPFGSRVAFQVPAQQVIVLEIRPAPDALTAPQLYGIPGTVESAAGGYRIQTAGQQGRTERFGLMLPSGAEPVASATVLAEPDEPDPRLNAPTPLELLSSGPDGALFEITYRRAPPPAELHEWRAEPAGSERGLALHWPLGLPSGERVRFPLFADTDIPLPLSEDHAGRLGLGSAANFCGAYIEYAFSETQETWIDVRCEAGQRKAGPPIVNAYRKNPQRALPPLATRTERAWWFDTTFQLPFLYEIGAEPAPDDHTIVVFPLLRQRQAKELRAWVNGSELPVRLYSYPRNRKFGCYYADLVGTAARGGENRLVVYLRF